MDTPLEFGMEEEPPKNEVVGQWANNGRVAKPVKNSTQVGNVCRTDLESQIRLASSLLTGARIGRQFSRLDGDRHFTVLSFLSQILKVGKGGVLAVTGDLVFHPTNRNVGPGTIFVAVNSNRADTTSGWKLQDLQPTPNFKRKHIQQ